MKSENFTKIMQFIFQWEGGYSNDPADPGGATNYGITQKTLDRYCATKGVPSYDVAQLKKLTALDIYEWGYWDSKWEQLGFPLAACMMDTCVNSGRTRAENLLKQSENDYVKYLQARLLFYSDLVKKNPSLLKFLRGWNNRVADLRRFIDENRDVPV